MALLDIKGWGKNPIVKNVDNTPLDIKGFEVGDNPFKTFLPEIVNDFEKRIKSMTAGEIKAMTEQQRMQYNGLIPSIEALGAYEDETPNFIMMQQYLLAQEGTVVNLIVSTPEFHEEFEDFSKPSDRLQEIEVWIEGYLAAAEKKYANISSKDPENLSLRIIKGEIIAIKRILQEFQAFMKNGITQEAKIFPHLDSPNPKDKANPPMKKMK